MCGDYERDYEPTQEEYERRARKEVQDQLERLRKKDPQGFFDYVDRELHKCSIEELEKYLYERKAKEAEAKKRQAIAETQAALSYLKTHLECVLDEYKIGAEILCLHCLLKGKNPPIVKAGDTIIQY